MTRKQIRKKRFAQDEWCYETWHWELVRCAGKKGHTTWTIGIPSNMSMYAVVKLDEYIYSPSLNVVLMKQFVDSTAPANDFRAVALLEMIWVPEWKRQQGLAKRMILAIQHQANKHFLKLAIGPIMDTTGAIRRIAKDYRPCMPWTLVQA